jgi:hypothetical protein
MRSAMARPAGERAAAFDALRRDFRTRHEFPSYAVRGEFDPDVARMLGGLGFALVE